MSFTYAENINNDANIVYTVPLVFGTPVQGNMNSNFLLDTTSEWIVVFSENCSDCNEYQKYYNNETSTTA